MYNKVKHVRLLATVDAHQGADRDPEVPVEVYW